MLVREELKASPQHQGKKLIANGLCQVRMNGQKKLKNGNSQSY